MPYVNNNGIRIYYEAEGQGPPLVLAHALLGSINSWRRDGYVDALKADFKLVLIDARGRGRSDKPHEASICDYNIMANDVLAVLDDLNITKTHYFGYSMGARVGFLLATRHKKRFHSFIFGGMTPYNIPKAAVTAFRDNIGGFQLLRTDPGAYLQRLENRYGRILTPEEKQSYLAQDAETLIAMHTAFLDSPSLTDKQLAAISLPCLVFCGELDEGGFHPGAKECANHMPAAEFVSFANLGHLQAGARSDLVVPHVREFLAGVNMT
jgi:pimeloyl-ACP methyl ester carboxylesterase